MLNSKQKEFDYLSSVKEPQSSPTHSKAKEMPAVTHLLSTDHIYHNQIPSLDYKRIYEDLQKDIENFVKEHEEYNTKTNYLFKQLIDEIKTTIKVKYPKIEVF